MTDTNVGGLVKPLLRGARTVSVDLHLHLRNLIIEGAIAPGTILKQAELARAFDVSRTPMREAFRMLQEEGLIDADPNQRPRVRGIDPAELDSLYAARIVLESLGARMTTGRLEPDEIERGHEMLRLMQDAKDRGATTEWLRAHREFHRICTARADAQLERAIASFGEQSERYLRTYQSWHPQSFARAHREHVAMLRAVSGVDPALSGSLMADHLSHTALNVLEDMCPGGQGTAVLQALAMATATAI